MPSYVAFLRAVTVGGERVTVIGSEVLAELTVGFHQTTLTSARIERITGRTTTWRDLEVVRAVDERRGA